MHRTNLDVAHSLGLAAVSCSKPSRQQKPLSQALSNSLPLKCPKPVLTKTQQLSVAPSGDGNDDAVENDDNFDEDEGRNGSFAMVTASSPSHWAVPPLESDDDECSATTVEEYATGWPGAPGTGEVTRSEDGDSSDGEAWMMSIDTCSSPSKAVKPAALLKPLLRTPQRNAVKSGGCAATKRKQLGANQRGTDQVDAVQAKKPRVRSKKAPALGSAPLNVTEPPPGAPVKKKAPSAYMNFSQFARPALIAAKPGISFSEVRSMVCCKRSISLLLDSHGVLSADYRLGESLVLNGTGYPSFRRTRLDGRCGGLARMLLNFRARLTMMMATTMLSRRVPRHPRAPLW